MKALLTLLVFLSITCFSQSQRADKELQLLADELKTVGLAVVVVKKGEIVYTKNLGWQNVENQIPLSDNSIFRIASISKSFSATAIMQLVEQKN